jgi:hypothetical protein
MGNSRLPQSQAPKGTVFPIRAVGREVAFHEDMYHSLLRMSWVQFFGLVALWYLVANAIFACLYLLQPGCIHDTRPGLFSDAVLSLTINGIDETSAQPLHARYQYRMNDIVPNAHFVDIVKVLDDGTREIDYKNFHLIEQRG